MDMSSFSTFFIGIILGGVIKVYKNNLDRKNHVIDRKRIGRIAKLSIKNTPIINVKLKYSGEIEYFYKVIKTKLPHVDLSLFNRNIDELVINEKYMGGDSGQYNVANIVMSLLANDEEKSIYQELLHLASSIFDGKIVFSGFRQASDEFDIGIGLNEGYTCLLYDRYFKKNENFYILRFICDLIEKIVNRKEMEKMYFNADLKGLIDELSKYCFEDKVYQLVRNMDLLFEINYILDNDKKFNEKFDDFQTAVYEISGTLFECYSNYLKKQYVKNLITWNELSNLLGQFSVDLASDFELGGKTLNFLTQELYNKLMNFHFPKNESIEEKSQIKL